MKGYKAKEAISRSTQAKWRRRWCQWTKHKTHFVKWINKRRKRKTATIYEARRRGKSKKTEIILHFSSPFLFAVSVATFFLLMLRETKDSRSIIEKAFFSCYCYEATQKREEKVKGFDEAVSSSRLFFSLISNNL